MTVDADRLVADASQIDLAGIQVPGATPDGLEAQLLNLDGGRGLIATIIHFKPGAQIPAHYHRNGAEAHYVLEGDLVDAGQSYGPGTYLTHAAGVVHGPHASKGGCRVLTLQGGKMNPGDADFHLVGEAALEMAPAAPEVEPGDQLNGPPTAPPDMASEGVDPTTLPETQKTAPTPDNPTNPSTG